MSRAESRFTATLKKLRTLNDVHRMHVCLRNGRAPWSAENVRCTPTDIKEFMVGRSEKLSPLLHPIIMRFFEKMYA